MTTTIVLHGEPMGKGRPRSRVAWTRDDKPFIAIYTPKATKDYENALAMAGKVAMQNLPLLYGPLAVEIDAIFSVPRSWSKKRRDAALAGVVRPTGRPDLDNVYKMMDALNGIAWKDDSQIVRAIVEKRYGERPMLFVEVSECEPFGGQMVGAGYGANRHPAKG